MLTIQHEKQRIFLKEKRTFEPDSFLSQAARWYVCERSPYTISSLDHTTHFFFAAWDTRRSCQGEIRARCRKRALTPPTHHPLPADHTADVHQEGSNPLSASSKVGSDLEASALDRPAGDASTLAPSRISPLLEVQVKSHFCQTKGESLDDCVNQRDGQEQPALGC